MDYTKKQLNEMGLEDLYDILENKLLSNELYCPSDNIYIAQTKSHSCDCKKCKEMLKKNPDYLNVNWESAKGKGPKEAIVNLILKL